MRLAPQKPTKYADIIIDISKGKNALCRHAPPTGCSANRFQPLTASCPIKGPKNSKKLTAWKGSNHHAERQKGLTIYPNRISNFCLTLWNQKRGITIRKKPILLFNSMEIDEFHLFKPDQR